LLAQWAGDQTSHLPIKSLKEQTKTCSGQAKFESYLSQGQAGIQGFCCKPTGLDTTWIQNLDTKPGYKRLAQGRQNLRATCLKGKLEFKLFGASPQVCSLIL